LASDAFDERAKKLKIMQTFASNVVRWSLSFFPEFCNSDGKLKENAIGK